MEHNPHYNSDNVDHQYLADLVWNTAHTANMVMESNTPDEVSPIIFLYKEKQALFMAEAAPILNSPNKREMFRDLIQMAGADAYVIASEAWMASVSDEGEYETMKEKRGLDMMRPHHFMVETDRSKDIGELTFLI